MRKKLLALLMCATMVLGTAVTASAYTPEDLDTADDIIDAYDDFDDEFEEEKSAKVGFTTFYNAAGVGSIYYDYYITGFNGGGAYVKHAKLADGKDAELTHVGTTPLTKDTSVDTTTTGIKVVNASATTDVAVGSLLKLTEALSPRYYYVVDVVDVPAKTASLTLAANEVLLRTNNANPVVAQGEKIAKLREYDPTIKTGRGGITSAGTEATAATFDTTATAGGFGVDPDGYIALKAATETGKKVYSKLTDEYYLDVTKTEVAKRADIAQAVSNGTISKDAVAVDFTFLKLNKAVNYSQAVGTATETGFMSLDTQEAALAPASVSMKVDWLSRTGLKTAIQKDNGVTAYVLDENIPNISDYFQRLDSVYKVSDVVGGKFSTNYLLTGTYIFDIAKDATDNAGQADADKPATDTTSSPKTGDVAPIAALAVVMMGAFGAMVVASKKRA